MTTKKEKDTMRIWSQVCETDPKHTKPVTYGRKYTAIAPYYQIKVVTDFFGPVGKGWKYSFEIKDVTETFIICYLEFFYKLEGEWSEPIPVISAINRFINSKDKDGKYYKKEDDDAYKKVVTDCLTKAFSLCGVSADVFMGMYDDNKYVQEQRAKHNQNPPQTTQQATQQKQTKDVPKSTGNGKDEPRTDKQRSMIWAKAMGLRNKNNQLAIVLIDKICEDLGFDSHNMTKTHASLVIEKLVEMEKENE